MEKSIKRLEDQVTETKAGAKASVREAEEEAGITADDLQVRAERLTMTAASGWTYITVIADVAQALKLAVKTSPAGGLTLVAGSLYVVGEAQAAVDNGIVRFNR